MIKFANVTKKFANDTHALNEVTFTVEPGEFVFITGPSGAGKTTIGRLLLGELFPTSGEILVGEYEVNKIKRKEIPSFRRQIGVIFQDFKLLSDRTAAENIALGLEIIGKDAKSIADRVGNLLILTGLQGKGNLFPTELSGGEIQRTVIARALAVDPAVLFADEPTGNLDNDTAWEIVKLLQEINQQGTTILMATHNQEIIDRAKKRQLHLEKGRLVNDSKKPKTETDKPAANPSETKTEPPVSPPQQTNETIAHPPAKAAPPPHPWKKMKTWFKRKPTVKNREKKEDTHE